MPRLPVKVGLVCFPCRRGWINSWGRWPFQKAVCRYTPLVRSEAGTGPCQKNTEQWQKDDAG